MRVALKVDVDTLRGTLEGVPNLLRLLERHRVLATFLFSLGPDHTGRALRRVFRPGFLAKVRRTSVASHYGLRTLLYGTLLPGPDIGRRGAAVMRVVAAAGHEVGIHCYDHIKWQDLVTRRDEDWTARELARAADAFARVFGRPARVHGAAGWQINPHVPRLEQAMGLDYASDCRGRAPFYPLLGGVRSHCPQIPTTLPTLDELLGCNGICEADVHESVMRACSDAPETGHVYTLHAELEGMQLQPVMERLLSSWRERGDRVGPMRDTYAALDLARLPVACIEQGEIPGRSGRVARQGLERCA